MLHHSPKDKDLFRGGSSGRSRGSTRGGPKGRGQSSSTTRSHSSTRSDVNTRSSSTNDTPRSRETPLDTVRKAQRSAITDRNRAYPQISGITPHIPTSTPLTSPDNQSSIGNKTSNAIGKLRNENSPGSFLTTPIVQSAGIALISNPPMLPEIDNDSPTDIINNYLDELLVHIDHYGNNLQMDKDWKSTLHSKYIVLDSNLNKAKVIALDYNYDALVTRCLDLSSKLEEYKMKWSIKCHSDSSTSGFHGFPSLVNNSDIDIGNQSVKMNAASLLQFTERLAALESSANGQNSLRAQFSELAQRLAVLEEREDTNLGSRMIIVEQTVNKISDVNSKINLTMDKLSGIELQCSSNNKDIASVKHDFKEMQDSQRSLIRNVSTLKDSLLKDLEEFKSSMKGMTHLDNTVQDHAILRGLNNNSNSSAHQQPKGNLNPNSESEQRVNSWLIHQPPSGTENCNQPQEPRRPVYGLTNKPSSTSKDPEQMIRGTGVFTAAIPPKKNKQSQETINSRDPSTERNDYSNANSTQLSSNVSAVNFQEKLLRTNTKCLRRLLSPKPSASLSKCTISDIHKNRLSAIHSQSEKLERAMHNYIKNQDHDQDLCELVSDTIADAANFSSEIRDLYQSLGIHKRSQASKLYDDLFKFTKHSDVGVFEFFRRFSAYTEDFDIPEEKAELLYNKFLSPEIQEEVSRFKHDYPAMKRCLTHRYGDLKTMTSDILLPVFNSTIPINPADSQSNLEYFRRLNSALQKINGLLNSEDVPREEAQGYIYSQDFIHLLLSYLPNTTKEKFVDKMKCMDEDTVRIRGRIPFRIILDLVDHCYQTADTVVRTELPPIQNSSRNLKNKDKAKPHKINTATTHSAITDTESDSDREPTKGSVKFQNKQKAKPVSQLKFPCILEGHKHQINECREFFFKSPQERFEEVKKFECKYCLICLQSGSCNSGKCSNWKDIPAILICKECKKNSFKPPSTKKVYSILYCFNEKHSKPSNPDIVAALEAYIPGFNADNLKAPINIAFHFQVLAGINSSSIKPESKSRQLNPLEPVPAFNTDTGITSTPSLVDVIPEVRHDSIGVMQYLNIGGQSVLCLFDRGANQHLIEGKIAEQIGMKVVNREPSAIGVVSGGRIWTEYGSYQMLLGPTSSGKYFELVAQGITAVTGRFPKYDLTAVNDEARNTTDLHPGTPLPTYVGSERVGLLIGLKCPEIEPICVFTLPSGIGLYKSQFKDIFGSYYCYGGPHESFTEINNKFHGNVNHFNIFFTEVVNQYRNSLYPSLLDSLQPIYTENDCALAEVIEPKVHYSYQSESGETIFPSPLGSQDFIELGQAVVDERIPDDIICSSQHCQCLNTTVLKAKVPLNKLRSFVDEQDMDDTVNFRCDICKLCKCSISNRSKMLSLNEKIEQEIIEKSVTVDLEKKCVFVDLPFIKPADKFLSDKHGGSDNYAQALKVYKSQCKRPESVKTHMRKAHAELVEKGFMKKVSHLPKEHQDLINNGAFRHYMPWRTIEKPESKTTPWRYVVDPSMSGLNVCLAKGQNKMKKIPDILTRARTRKYIWTSDISKLYNRLMLKPTSYRYQLFLYGDELDPDKEPEIYAMIVAWYGVASSGNQSGFALEELARLLKADFPLAYLIITEDTYVDDMIGGGETEEECDEQIRQVKHVLQAGGFTTKYTIKSGQTDTDDTLRVLGYKWTVAKDLVSPGFTELNFNSKKRGAKAPNPFPIQKPGDVSLLLSSKDISRRMIVSKMAEFWDPCGYWEPYKLQLKLDSQVLNGKEWDTAVSPDLQAYWISRFQEFLEIPRLTMTRYIFPNNVKVESIRLLCISDAAEFAGGCAIYAGVELPDGSYSCKLVASKSRLMSNSVPRNELEGIRISAGLALDVKSSIGNRVKEVIFVTDSSIALSWCHNTKKRLRLYCLNRVMEIRRLIEAIVGQTVDIPLYHIDGKVNPADYITKPSNLKPADLTEESEWISGFPWMLLPTESMPLTSFSDLQLSATQNQLINAECFPEVTLPSDQVAFLNDSLHTEPDSTHCSGCMTSKGHFTLENCYGTSYENPHCIKCNCATKCHSFVLEGGKGFDAMVDIMQFGFDKSLKIMSRVFDFVWSFIHKSHLSRGLSESLTCRKCIGISQSSGIPVEYFKILKKEALQYYLRLETSRILLSSPKDKVAKFQLKDDILYAIGRVPENAVISQKDLDFEVFFDGSEIKGVLPVVSADSELFFAFLIHVHHNLRKHAGNEATLGEIMKVVYPINNPRRIIQAVRKNCPRCRMILKKTLELEIGQHPESRYQIVPAFYHSMCDIVYGFKSRPYKEARTASKNRPVSKLYALVIVCLLTSATSILALEGLETQDVVMALERHSGRHGTPSCLFVDQGTQLTNLDKVEMALRDATLKVRESVGIEIVPSTAKSHMARGRVERKIRTLRDMLKKSAVSTDVNLTAIQWETVFSKMASEIDDIPIARADKAANSDFGWDILTPNRFKLGRSNMRAVEGPMYLKDSSSPSQLLKRIQQIQSYWYQLLLDRIHHLVPRPEGMGFTDEFQLEDIVIFRFKDNDSSKLEKWKLGKIVEILKAGRGVLVSYPCIPQGSKVADVPVMRFVERSPRDISVVSSMADLNMNSKEFFTKIKKLS